MHITPNGILGGHIEEAYTRYTRTSSGVLQTGSRMQSEVHQATWYLQYIRLARFEHAQLHRMNACCRIYASLWNLRAIRCLLFRVSIIPWKENNVTYRSRSLTMILIEYASSPSPSDCVVKGEQKIEINNPQYLISLRWILKPSFSLYRVKAGRLDLRTCS